MEKTIYAAPITASFGEMAMYSIKANIEEFNKIAESFAIEDLDSLIHEANGGKISADKAKELFSKSGDKVKKIVDQVIDVIKKAWARVKGIYDKAIAQMKALAEKASNKINALVGKQLNKISNKARENAINKLVDSSTLGKRYDWKPEYDKIITGNSEYMKALDKFEDGVIAVNNKYNDPMVLDHAGVEAAKKDIDEILADSRKDLFDKLGVSESNTAEVAKKVEELIYGKEKVDLTGEYVKKNLDTMIMEINNNAGLTEDLKKSFKAAKKSFDETIKSIKKLEKSKNDYAVFKISSALVKQKNIYTMVTSAVTKAICRRFSENVSIVLKVAMKVKSDEAKEEVTSESTIEPATFQSELASLFDF